MNSKKRSWACLRAVLKPTPDIKGKIQTYTNAELPKIGCFRKLWGPWLETYTIYSGVDDKEQKKKLSA